MPDVGARVRLQSLKMNSFLNNELGVVVVKSHDPDEDEYTLAGPDLVVAERWADALAPPPAASPSPKQLVPPRHVSNTPERAPPRDASASFAAPVTPTRRDDATFVIDAKYHGNVGRFFNHSCNPNMRGRVVYVATNLPSFAFFALRGVPAGAELTWDYGWRPVPSRDANPLACRCGESTCRGRLR